MGAGKGGKGQIAKYLMSLHAGICMSGPGITLTGLYYGEKNFSPAPAKL